MSLDEATDATDSDDTGPSALVQEAACAERVIVLKVRVPGRTSFIIVGASKGGASGAGLLSSAARRAIWGGRLPAGLPRQRAREDALVGARVLALGLADVFIDQQSAPRVVRATGGRVVVTDAASCDDATPFLTLTSDQEAELEARGVAIAHAIAADAVEARRAEIVRILDRAIERIERRREAIRGDLGKIAKADRLASQAQWLVAEAVRTPRGATQLVVTDWSSGEAVAIVVPLDPAKSAKDQVAAMFRQAKRLRLGASIAEERLAEATARLLAIHDARRAAIAAVLLVEIEDIARKAKSAAPRDVALPSSAAGPATTKSGKRARTPHRTFFARSGRKVLVGKGAADNDALTLKIARPHDLWLHAKDRTGAHVVVPLDRGQSCPAEDLVDAAHLAAHFSEAREEKIVDVQYTDRRFLRKPRGSAPGAVLVAREKVIVLRVEAEILRGLLEREDL